MRKRARVRFRIKETLERWRRKDARIRCMERKKDKGGGGKMQG
jgi:hypothetical protein